MNELQQKIITELEAQTIPDLKFLFSDEVLDEAVVLLKDLLAGEKEKFENKLLTPDSEITFETFNDESILDYFWGYINHLKGVYSSDKVRDIIEEIEPLLVDYSNIVSYSKRYFEMLEICLKNNELDQEQTKIITDVIVAYKVKGINLPEEKQSQLKEISKKMSKLTTSFSNNELDSENEFEYYIESIDSIKDLPKDVLERAEKTTNEKGGKKEGYTFTANPSDYTNIMKFCSNGKIREDFYKARVSFASSGKYDNRQNVLHILQLREQKAQLLGYKNYAELSLEFKMADSPEQVLELIGGISDRARVKGKEEIAFLKDYFDLEELLEWDTGFYYRKLKEEKYKLDDKELKKYFEFEAVLEGLFNIVGRLFGITLEEITDIESRKMFGEESDVRIYKVFKGGEQIAYYLLDSFYRKEKRAGAWADVIRAKFGTKLPFIVNVCNFSKNKSEVTLLTLGEVETIFHEFGHATHEMTGKSKYSDLSGFNVEWDFVEVPSQFLEHWCQEKESLVTFAKHYETGEIIPKSYISTLDQLSKIGNGNGVLGQNALTLVDMLLHSSSVPASIDELDEKILSIVNSNSNFEKGDYYKMYTSFSHIFAGGYAAGYYSYMWAEIIELDILREFKKTSMFDPMLAEKYTTTILEAGSTKKAGELFKDFMGREVDLQGFFDKKGL